MLWITQHLCNNEPEYPVDVNEREEDEDEDFWRVDGQAHDVRDALVQYLASQWKYNNKTTTRRISVAMMIHFYSFVHT